MDDLPTEIKQHIIGYLDQPRDYLKLLLLSRAWHSIQLNEMCHLLQQRFQTTAPNPADALTMFKQLHKSSTYVAGSEIRGAWVDNEDNYEKRHDSQATSSDGTVLYLKILVGTFNHPLPGRYVPQLRIKSGRFFSLTGHPMVAEKLKFRVLSRRRAEENLLLESRLDKYRHLETKVWHTLEFAPITVEPGTDSVTFRIQETETNLIKMDLTIDSFRLAPYKPAAAPALEQQKGFFASALNWMMG
ncbi:hypothetical protein HDU91_001331 [Kappamyces sp. JEL0680]|nr:hypothetical protein HDU91_001331 [Kappamyces sp. JEL0680]